MAHLQQLDSLRDTAASWFERANRENDPTEIQDALNAWLKESPEHAAAYQSIALTFSRLQSATDLPAILALRQETAQRLRPATTFEHGRRWAAAAVIVLSLGVALWFVSARTGLEFSPLAWLKPERNPVTQSYATKTGDRLTVALEDGSKVTLNTETQLDVAFSKASRTVRLTRGQALFEVAKDKSRPFVVQTESRRFIAVGTAFDVFIDQGQVKVTMLEGTVRSESIGPGSQIRSTVTAGEQLIANSHSEDRISRVDPQRETSWRNGQLIFDNTPLREAIGELNRYSSTHIQLADPKLGDLRLSGTFATGGTKTFVEAVTAYFPLQIEHADTTTVTLKARD